MRPESDACAAGREDALVDCLAEENRRLRSELRPLTRAPGMWGCSHGMQDVFERVALLARQSGPVLVWGEPGTGRRLAARAIHDSGTSPEATDGLFWCLDSRRRGLLYELDRVIGEVLESSGSTLCLSHLDHLEELGEPVADRLSGAGLLGPGGPNRAELVNDVGARWMAASGGRLILTAESDGCSGSLRGGRPILHRLVEAGQEPSRLFMPPLRKRPIDILVLVDGFLSELARHRDLHFRISSTATDLLLRYPWPGNVSELRTSVMLAVERAEADVVHGRHLPWPLQATSDNKRSLKGLVECFERDLLQETLRRSRGDVGEAARALATTERIVRYRSHKYSLDPSDYRP